MKVIFKKRRYYKGILREPGDVVSMEYKHARAFINVNAAIPAGARPNKKKKQEQPKEPPKRTTPPSTPAPETQEVEFKGQTPIEIVEDEVEGDGVDVEEVEELQVPEVQPLDDLSYRELQERCREKGVSARGATPELIERLKAEE